MPSSISTVSQTGPCLLFVCRSSCKKLFTGLNKVFSSVPIFFRGADAYYDHKRVFDYHNFNEKRTQFSQLSEVRDSSVYFAYTRTEPQVNFYVLFTGLKSTFEIEAYF